MKKKVKFIGILLTCCVVLNMFTTAALAAYENTYKNSGTGADDIVAVAQTQTGYTEESSGYTKYGSFMGNSTMDWCAAFICWCANEAGISTSVIPQNASSSGLYSYFKSHKLTTLSQYQGSSYIPKKGDIVFISNYDYSESGINHVGLVTGVSGKTVFVTEGNYNAWDGQRNKVANTSYALDAQKLIAFASPDYSGDGSSTTTEPTGDLYRLNETLRFRTAPDIDSALAITSLIPAGTVLTVTEIDETDPEYIWGKTTYNGVAGWVCLNWATYTGSSVITTQREIDWLVVDLSQWQISANIDWAGMKKAGVKAVILRVGGRGYENKTLYADTEFTSHYKAAKAAGLYVGAYFFSYALTEAQAREEANFTIARLQENNCILEMPVFIDIEDSDNGQMQHSKAGKAVCTAVVNEFCDVIEKAGYYPGIYCSKSFAEDLISPSAFKDRAVWIAHYGVTECGYSGSYDMWQYTQYGELAAYNGYLDLNHCYVDFPSIIASLALPDSFGEHTPSDWTTVKAASCTESGTREIVCTDKNCGVTLVTDTVKPLSHTNSTSYCYLNNTSLTPGDVLTSEQRSELKSATESNIEACKNDGGTIITYCTACNTVTSAEYYYTGCSHSSTRTKTTASTCTEQGVTQKVCTSCNKTVSSTLLVFASHKTGDLKLEGVSCINDGEQNIFCAECDELIRTEFCPATGHIADEWVIKTSPTFDEDGLMTAVCTVCDVELQERIEKVIYCDIDMSGDISSNDARIALRAAVGLEELTIRQKVAADVDNNGKIDTSDARLILRISVKLDSSVTLQSRYYGE